MSNLLQIIGNAVSHGRGPAISAVGAKHVIIASNLVSCEPGLNTTGIAVDSSTDVLVSANNVRGFVRNIAVLPPLAGKSDRVQIRGNSVDVTGTTGAVAVSVAVSVVHAVVSDNVVTGAAASAAGGSCVSLPGANSSTRVERNNDCW